MSDISQEEVKIFLSSEGESHVEKQLSKKDVDRIHHYFGHLRPFKVRELIKDAGKLTKEVEEYIEDLKSCEPCLLHKNKVPRPKISLPRAKDFNEMVTVDLKENTRYPTAPKFILYIVDSFSRFIRACFIKDKRAETVANAIWELWIEFFGPMGTLHSDLGREFVNDEMAKLCEKFDMKQTTTAAQSAHQNGRCERNHALCDRMVDKMCTADPTLSPEMALKHAVMAHNTLANYKGFSPCQVVFNKNPVIPTILSTGPPGLEEIKMTAKVARNLATMQSAKEAFIQCEADKIIAETLKSRIYIGQGQSVEPGTWVYFKQHGKLWKGPVKIHSVDGKKLYAVRGGKLQCINKDDVILSKAEEQILREENSLTRIPVEKSPMEMDKDQVVSHSSALRYANTIEPSTSTHSMAPSAVSPTEPLTDNMTNTIEPPTANTTNTIEPTAANTTNIIEPSTANTTITTTENVEGENASVDSVPQEESSRNTDEGEEGISDKLKQKLVQCRECASVMNFASVVAHNRNMHSITGKGRILSIPANEEAVKLYVEKQLSRGLKERDMIKVEFKDGASLYEITGKAKPSKGKTAWFVKNLTTGEERRLCMAEKKILRVGRIINKDQGKITYQNNQGEKLVKPAEEFYRYLSKDQQDDKVREEGAATNDEMSSQLSDPEINRTQEVD